MKEHEAILKDLQEYLKSRGAETEVIFYSNKWMLGIKDRKREVDYYCFIKNGNIVMPLVYGNSVVAISLANPGYREKFYEEHEKFLTLGLAY